MNTPPSLASHHLQLFNSQNTPHSLYSLSSFHFLYTIPIVVVSYSWRPLRIRAGAPRRPDDGDVQQHVLPHLLFLLVIASRAPQYPSLAHARFPRTASARRGGGSGGGGGGGGDATAGEGAEGGAAVESEVEEARGVELLLGESEVLGESEGGGDRRGRVCRHGIPPPPPAEAPPPTPPAPARCTISRDVAYRDHCRLLQGTSIMIHRPYHTNSSEHFLVHSFKFQHLNTSSLDPFRVGLVADED